MSHDIGMSPTGHGEGPPSDTATPGFEAWGLLVFGLRHPPRYGRADETWTRGCTGQRSCLCSLRLLPTSSLRVCRGAFCMKATNAMAGST